MMDGSVGILNVGAGDIKLSFDKANPVDRIRAARIVKDMLRRGFVLLVEVEPGKFQRAKGFDEEQCCYIIADFDPTSTRPYEDPAPCVQRVAEIANGEQSEAEAHPAQANPPADQPKRRGGRQKKVKAEEARAVAVGRTAGG